MKATIEALERFDILAGLPREALEEIGRLVKKEEHSAGAVLFHEGSSAESLYLLVSGKVSLEKRVQLGSTGTPRRAPISVIGPWQAVGWSSLVSPYVYTSSGVCLEDSVVYALAGGELRTLMERNPAIGYEVMSRVASITRSRLTNVTATLTYFLSIVSHELKRPIAAVENYLQVVLGGYAGDVTEKQQRLLERCALRLSDLRALISGILDFARMQPEQIRADFELVDPMEIGVEAIEEVRLAATQKNILLKAAGQTKYSPIVAAHRRLRQVVSNLLANAVKFSPENSTVTLKAQENGDILVIEVMDEGIGIPAEDQKHIFDDFYRGSNVADVGGTGLGLSITKKIVEAHDGTIEVESPYLPGKPGTKFTVRISRSLPLPGAFGTTSKSKGISKPEDTEPDMPDEIERQKS
jgi:signal transduction histidine kinase